MIFHFDNSGILCPYFFNNIHFQNRIACILYFPPTHFIKIKIFYQRFQFLHHLTIVTKFFITIIITTYWTTFVFNFFRKSFFNTF